MCEKAWKAFIRTWFFELDEAIVQFLVCMSVCVHVCFFDRKVM